MRCIAPVQKSRTEGLEGERASDRWWTVSLLATIVVSLVVRVIALGSKSVFADELASFRLAQLNWIEFWRLLRSSEANMALYYVLLRFWVYLGHSVAVVRLFSVVPAVATVPIIYALGKDLFWRTTGLFASLLFALNAFHISYSQAARGYSLAVFLVTLSCWFFTRSVREPNTKNLIAYVIASAAALYGHFFAGFVLLAQCASLIFGRPVRAVLFRQALLMLAVAVLGIPIFIFATVHKTGPIFWVEPTSAKGVYHFLTYLGGSGLRFGLSIIALALAMKQYFRTRVQEAHDGTAWSFTFLAMWLLVPLLATLLISIWKPVFSPRFLMICLPAFALLVGEGLSVIRPAWAEYAVAGTFLLSCATALPAYYRQPDIEDWKSAVAYLHQRVQPADSILVNNPSFREILVFSFHEFQTEPPTQNIISGPASESLIRRVDHTWLVLCHPRASEEAETRALRRKFVSRETAQFVGIRIVELDRGQP